MSKNIRQKIAHAIQTTFRQSSSSAVKSNKFNCCNVPKPADYEYVQYLPKTTTKSALSSRDDYIDLSECHSSISPSTSIDSGISNHTNISSISSSNQNLHQLHSTTNDGEDGTCSLSTLSNLSYIRHDEMNISNFDVTGWNSIPTSFECCQCQCHHHTHEVRLRNDVNNLLYVPEASRERKTKNEILPFIL